MTKANKWEWRNPELILQYFTLRLCLFLHTEGGWGTGLPALWEDEISSKDMQVAHSPATERGLGDYEPRHNLNNHS